MLVVNFPQWDTDLFTYLNGKHVDWLDPIMQVLSSSLSWIALFVVVSYFMIRKSKYWAVRELMIIAAVVLTNSLINNLLKLFFQRPRPCASDELRTTIHLLEDCGTHYSFFSAHSSNAFCLAICTALFFRNKAYSIAIYAWAIAVAYSRIYVGKHYPLDVVCGIFFGILMSLIGNHYLSRYRLQPPTLAQLKEEEEEEEITT